MGELEILERAHRLLIGGAAPVRLGDEAGSAARSLLRVAESTSGRALEDYHRAAAASRATMTRTADVDAEFGAVVRAARRDHADAQDLSARILRDARADTANPALTPLAAREALRRSAYRVRRQQRVIVTARRRALRRAALLRLLRYRALQRRGGGRLPAPAGRAGAAVQAALTRLGRPYVWGATGPDTFDCSGLVQWAYRQAGISLHRTTYEQIHDGIAVPRTQVEPGDLVFPHTGHVQMAIGNGLVVEAPHAGATVRISRLGDAIAIRRPG